MTLKKRRFRLGGRNDIVIGVVPLASLEWVGGDAVPGAFLVQYKRKETQLSPSLFFCGCQDSNLEPFGS